MYYNACIIKYVDGIPGTSYLSENMGGHLLCSYISMWTGHTCPNDSQDNMSSIIMIVILADDMVCTMKEEGRKLVDTW